MKEEEKEEEEKEEEEAGGGGGRGGDGIDLTLKSNNTHLTGGEQILLYLPAN